MRLTLQLVLGLALLTVIVISSLLFAAAGTIGWLWHGTPPEMTGIEVPNPSSILLLLLTAPVVVIPLWWFVQCIHAKRNVRELESGRRRFRPFDQFQQPLASSQDQTVAGNGR